MREPIGPDPPFPSLITCILSTITPYHGSCLCSEASWTCFDSPITALHCHCSRCRKAHGAAFASYYFFPMDHFQWTGNLSSIIQFSTSPGITRAFCGICGSVTPAADTDSNMMGVPAGCHHHGPAICAHIFVDSKAPWHEITDHLPQHRTYPPGINGPVLQNTRWPPKPEGVVSRGSCLCRTVTFEVTESFHVVHNCYCSRCRRARATAFTTNGFTSSKGVRFLTGADHIHHYKLPEARYFTQAFCTKCGSGLPRIDTERNLAVTPLGVLDDPPGQGPVDHIFVADRANWYEIGGPLPQFCQEPN